MLEIFVSDIQKGDSCHGLLESTWWYIKGRSRLQSSSRFSFTLINRMSLQTRLCLSSSSGSTVDRIWKMKDLEKCVDDELWHACAGSMVKMPELSSLVYYFPQGHAEHAQSPLDNLHMMNPSSPPHVLCRVASLKFMADPETDEVFVKTLLVPIKENPCSDHLMNDDDSPDEEVPEKPMSFTKTLTQSDANNGSGFTVPKQFALSMFPMLNYENDPPVQYICCADVHGEMWSFRHIYRGSPKRHLLTEEWSKFVKRKKLVAGDSIVFLKKENREIHVGIRRSRRSDMFSSRRIRRESVMETVRKASSGKAFEVEYYPRAGTPEYCVKAALVREAISIPWCLGMRFKMAVESEDQSRISWFTGTITGIKKKSLWRQLEVRWEEATGLLDDVKRVNPWLVEPVSNMCLPPLCLDEDLSLPTKKLCLPMLPTNFDCLSSMNQFQVPLPSMYYGYEYRNGSSMFSAGAGIQGSRHATTTNRCKSGFRLRDNDVGKDDEACVLYIGVGHSAATTNKSCDAKKESKSTSTTTFKLFGQTMVINEEEEQISDVSSSGNNKSVDN